MDEEILKWKRKHPEAVRASMANPANYWNLPNKGFVHLSVFYPILVVEIKNVEFEREKCQIESSYHFWKFLPEFPNLFYSPLPQVWMKNNMLV